MDNLFSFPAAALSAASSALDGAAAAPAQGLSSRTTPTAESSELTEQHHRVLDASVGSAAVNEAHTTIHLKLKMLNERVFDVYVERALSVAELRVNIEHVTQVPAGLQRLIYRGKLLKDGALLSTYDIQDGHTIHLVTRPVDQPPASSSDLSPPPVVRADAEDDALEDVDRVVGRSRQRLRQSVAELRSTMAGSSVGAGLNDPGVLRPPTMGTTRVRRPGNGELTGDAWNLAVLREALGDQSDRVPARPSNRNPTPVEALRQGHEQRQMAQNDAPAATATVAAMGLSTAASDQRPNLDYLSQGIMTLRTVLSTAPLPENNDEAAEQDEEEDFDEPTPRQRADDDQAHAQEGSTPVVSLRSPPCRGRRRLFVGQWLDVKDTVNQWLECTVMDMSEEKVLVHYHGWPSRWDEWIDVDSDRIAAFRTRTLHTQTAVHLSPAPSTRLPNAPSVGENDMRGIIPQLRDLMEEVLPYVNQLATLCENQDEHYGEDEDRRRQELSEMAHLVAPFFDRFGRVLVDSARHLDPFLHPDIRHDERRRRLMRARGSRQASSASAEAGDSAVGIRDMITSATRPPQEPQNTRRSIDVHIHAIVAPSSLSSLASLARLGTAIAGAMGSSSSRLNSSAIEAQRGGPNDLEDAFGLPRLRPLQVGSGERSILADIADPDDEDSRYTDTSRTPLLSSFRRPPSRSDVFLSGSDGASDSSLLRPRRPMRSSSSRLNDFLRDDFFGPSFSQDSDEMDDPLTSDGFGAIDHSRDDVVQYHEIPSPRDSEEERTPATSASEIPTIGIIPEIEEAEQRERERDLAGPSSGDASRSSASSSTGSSFLDVMRRTLSEWRTPGFSSSSGSPQSEDAAVTNTTATTARTMHSVSGSFSSSSSDDIDETDAARLEFARSAHFSQPLRTSFARPREPSSASSIEEDLDSVD